MANQPNLNRLKSQLLITGLQKKDNPLFQVINQLIVAVRQLQGGFTTDIQNLTVTINNVPVVIVTKGYWTFLTDGDVNETDFIFANGDPISIFVPVI